MGADLIVQDLTTFGVLFFLFLIFYSKFKKQTMKESMSEIKGGIKNMTGSDDE